MDQFVRTPKSQAKWYQQYRIRQDTNTRPGKSIFSWSDSEARLNSQFSRIAKVSSYPQLGPASRRVPQDILRRWEKCAREGTYVTNHAAAFNRCTNNIQEKMNAHIALLNDTSVKGKAPKEIVDATRDLRDLYRWHLEPLCSILLTAFSFNWPTLFSYVETPTWSLSRLDLNLTHGRDSGMPHYSIQHCSQMMFWLRPNKTY